MNNLKKELFRKSIHICSAFVPLLLHFFYWLTIGLLIFAVLFYILTEILRLKGKRVPLITFITETASRDRDKGKIVLGPVFLVLGILLAALILPEMYGAIGIFALAFGDGCASLFGKWIGKHKIIKSSSKTLEGSLACFTAVFISSFLVSKRPVLSLLEALFVTLIEFFSIGNFDNLIIPLTGGSFFLFLNYFF